MDANYIITYYSYLYFLVEFITLVSTKREGFNKNNFKKWKFFHLGGAFIFDIFFPLSKINSKTCPESGKNSKNFFVRSDPLPPSSSSLLPQIDRGRGLKLGNVTIGRLDKFSKKIFYLEPIYQIK